MFYLRAEQVKFLLHQKGYGLSDLKERCTLLLCLDSSSLRRLQSYQGVAGGAEGFNHQGFFNIPRGRFRFEGGGEAITVSSSSSSSCSSSSSSSSTPSSSSSAFLSSASSSFTSSASSISSSSSSSSSPYEVPSKKPRGI